MSFIMEQAGGASTTGRSRVLELQPTKIHQREPIYIGCQRDVDLILSYLREAEAAEGAAAGGPK